MIRGLLQKGSELVKAPSSSSSSSVAAPPPSDAKAVASTSSTSTESSSSSSYSSRPTVLDDPSPAAVPRATCKRDSTGPIATSKSAIKPPPPPITSSYDPYSSTNHLSMLPAAAPEPRAGKKCSLCGKNFNPLRRRYFCRVCTIEVCSNCSLKRKVDSSLEGAISIRICMSCKMNTSGPQNDYYDRAFSIEPTLSGGGHDCDSVSNGGDALFSTDVFGDRTSAASFVSAAAPAAMTRPYFSSTSSVTSSSAHTPAHHSHSLSQSHNGPTSKSSKAQTPGSGPVSGGLRRTSSVASTASATARSRRDSFGSTAAPAECQMCMNEACGPMTDLSEVQYPALEARGYGPDRFIRARSLDNELVRLETVRRLRRVLAAAPATATQRFAQLCSMASIATQSRMAVISLLDRDEYVVVSETGLPPDAAPVARTLSLAAHTCRNGAPLVCSDLSADVRFAGNPWRRDTLRVLFYAGIPLTLSNGHTIGTIEVFDTTPRFACMDVVTQLQAVVRGLLKVFDELLASAPVDGGVAGAVTGTGTGTGTGSTGNGPATAADPIAAAIAQLERTTSYGEMKPTSAASSSTLRSPVRRAPAPTAPPAVALPTAAAAATNVATTAAAAVVEPVTVAVPAVSTPAPTEVMTPAPAAPAGPTENEMELRLMELLSQTTSTQEQLRNQQGQMVHAISSHSKQITELAKQLERMESTLASKLDGLPTKDTVVAGPTTAAVAVTAETPETAAP